VIGVIKVDEPVIPAITKPNAASDNVAGFIAIHLFIKSTVWMNDVSGVTDMTPGARLYLFFEPRVNSYSLSISILNPMLNLFSLFAVVSAELEKVYATGMLKPSAMGNSVLN